MNIRVIFFWECKQGLIQICFQLIQFLYILSDYNLQANFHVYKICTKLYLKVHIYNKQSGHQFLPLSQHQTRRHLIDIFITETFVEHMEKLWFYINNIKTAPDNKVNVACVSHVRCINVNTQHWDTIIVVRRHIGINLLLLPGTFFNGRAINLKWNTYCFAYTNYYYKNLFLWAFVWIWLIWQTYLRRETFEYIYR